MIIDTYWVSFNVTCKWLQVQYRIWSLFLLYFIINMTVMRCRRLFFNVCSCVFLLLVMCGHCFWIRLSLKANLNFWTDSKLERLPQNLHHNTPIFHFNFCCCSFVMKSSSTMGKKTLIKCISLIKVSHASMHHVN